MIVHIFISPSSQILIDLHHRASNDVVIGVEQGAYMLAKNKITIDHAVGDFDSVSDEEIDLIRRYAKKITKHPVKKNQTDTEIAIDLALALHPEEIIVYGGLGSRFDHSYANTLLLQKGPIKLISESNMMYVLHPGKHVIQNDYNYISFFALEEVIDLHLKDFYYNLETKRLTRYDPLCISNEGSGTVAFEQGLLLVIHAQDEAL